MTTVDELLDIVAAAAGRLAHRGYFISYLIAPHPIEASIWRPRLGGQLRWVTTREEFDLWRINDPASVLDDYKRLLNLKVRPQLISPRFRSVSKDPALRAYQGSSEDRARIDETRHLIQGCLHYKTYGELPDADLLPEYYLVATVDRDEAMHHRWIEKGAEGSSIACPHWIEPCSD